jgi:hypothetical protein
LLQILDDYFACLVLVEFHLRPLRLVSRSHWAIAFVWMSYSLRQLFLNAAIAAFRVGS